MNPEHKRQLYIGRRLHEKTMDYINTSNGVKNCAICQMGIFTACFLILIEWSRAEAHLCPIFYSFYVFLSQYFPSDTC